MSFTQRNARALTTRISRLSARGARDIVKPLIPSRTLRRALRTERNEDGSISLSIPVYWAIYVHDGRGPIQMPAGQFLVYFLDKRDDPRHNGRFPRTQNEVRQLTRAEFQFYLDINTQRRAAGQEPLMIVAKRVGPVRGSFFFTKGLRAYKTDPRGPSRVAPREFSNYVLTRLRAADLLNIKDTAIVRVGPGR